MKIIVTGANSFTARHLITALNAQNAGIIVRTDFSDCTASNVITCDLSDVEHVIKLISTTHPDRIYHLAGTFSNDYNTDYTSNVLATKNIFDAVLTCNIRPKILLVGSAAEYGVVSVDENPVKETQQLKPTSYYGLTKMFQTGLMNMYHTVYGIDVRVAREFNLLGDGMHQKLFVGSIQKQIAAYLKKDSEYITVGTLSNKRDYIPIQKAINYFIRIMEYGLPGEVYNVGSGKSVAMYEILKTLLIQNNIPYSVVKADASKKSNAFDVHDIYADMEKTDKLFHDSSFGSKCNG